MFRIKRTKGAIRPGVDYFQEWVGEWAALWTHDPDTAEVFQTQTEADRVAEFLRYHFPDDCQNGEPWTYEVD